MDRKEEAIVSATIEEKVKKIIVDQLGVEEAEVTAEAKFIDDLGADSLDTVELVMALEEEFGIEIPDEDAEKITTVKDAYRAQIPLGRFGTAPEVAAVVAFLASDAAAYITGQVIHVNGGMWSS